MHDFIALTPYSTGSLPTDQDAYEAACSRCEQWIVLDTADDRVLVTPLLVFDKNPEGGHGRTLTRSVPRLGLLDGDRLEPGGDVSRRW